MLGQGPHRAEPRVYDGNEDGFGAPGHDRVGITAADGLERFSDGAAAGGAG